MVLTSPPGTQVDAATLGCDGTVSIEQSAGALGTTYTKEYREIQGGATYFSESAWNALTGQAVDLAPAPVPMCWMMKAAATTSPAAT